MPGDGFGTSDMEGSCRLVQKDSPTVGEVKVWNENQGHFQCRGEKKSLTLSLALKNGDKYFLLNIDNLVRLPCSLFSFISLFHSVFPSLLCYFLLSASVSFTTQQNAVLSHNIHDTILQHYSGLYSGKYYGMLLYYILLLRADSTLSKE